ncbi:MAG: helix-turn-helix domain-containing protein [Actinomycetota bacterium]|nr:helix-turn-helix domain-containing protein [Actinomycetota bacterium]
MVVLIASEGGAGRIENLLAAEGYHTLAYDPEGGMPLIDQSQAWLLVLHVGFNTNLGLKRLRQFKSAYPDVPVIFLTEFHSVDVVLAVFRAGARDYFSVPLDEAGFKESVCALIRCRKAEAAGNSMPFLAASETHPVYAGMAGAVASAIPSGIRRVVNSLEGNFAKETSLESMSEKAGVSKYHFCRMFKKYTGLSPMHYLARVRVERAKELLQSTSSSISTVAAEVGFNDLSSFIKHFKRVAGCTPRTFKKFSGAVSAGNKKSGEISQNLRLF